MANFKCTVTVSALHGRGGPGTIFSIRDKKTKGQVIQVKKTKQNSDGSWWYQDVTGWWYCYKTADGETYMRIGTLPDSSGGSSGGSSSGNNTTVGNTTVVPSQTVNNSTVQTSSTSSTETISRNDSARLNSIQQMINNRNSAISEAVDGSVRLFGLPHQFTPYTDHRLSSTTNLGRMFTETFVLDAPSVFIKPGTSNFLPGMSESDKKGFFNAITELEANDSNAKSLKDKLLELTGSTANVKYFDFVPKYSEYMSKVNMLCRLCAVFMGIHKMKVPWVNSSIVTFGNYDWRYYKFKSTYTNYPFTTTADDVANKSPLDAFRETFQNFADSISKDDSFVQFYVDAGSSFNESASNSTTQSMLTSYTDMLSSVGKELAFVSGVGVGALGTELDDAIRAGGSAAESWIDSNFSSDKSTVGNLFRRLFSTSNQLIAGGNFIVPDIWSSSEYGKSYSFTISLSTPYGNKMSIYLNLMVPLMHILAAALPTQVGANAYTSPNLIKAFSPGWFSCDLGIIDSISIDKGGSGDAWSSAGLPTELKINIGIRDLYSNLALPEKYSITDFFTNDNLINYLMVNCGIDITDQNFSTTLNVLTNLFTGSIIDKVTTPVHSTVANFKDWVRNLYGLYH